MLDAAEAVAAEMGATREELDDLTALRWAQYAAGLAEDRAFQRRYQVPVELPQRKGTLTLATGEGVVRVLASGFARVAKSRMPQAPVPAALSALQTAGREITDVDAITTHNPFAVNDLYFARETGVKPEDMNAYGCSLVFGHPQGPTGLRSIAELIETLRLRGGGVGLFTGCAAGDTGAALVVEVTDP